MSNAARFWNRMAKRYAKSPIRDVDSYQHKIDRAQTLMTPDAKVLEFACGTGNTAVQLAPHAAEYRAVDISEEMIRIARERDGADRVSFEVADFDTLDLEAESLDMIQAYSILHLLPDPKATIAKVHASLKPGGHFVSSTICLAGIWYLRLIVPPGAALGLLPPLRFLRENAVRAMLTDAGFEITYDWHPEGRITGLFLVARKAK